MILLASCGAQSENLKPVAFYTKSEEIIQNLEKANKDSGQYFMLGQAYKEQKQFKKALFCFANSCFLSYKNEKLTLYPMPIYIHISSFRTKSPYYEDALYEIALVMHSYQEYAYAEKFLKKIGKTNYGLYIDAQILLSRILQAQKEGPQALDILSGVISGASNTPTKQKLLIRRASLYENLDNYDKAADDYISVMEQDEKSWQAGLAASRLYQFLYKNPGDDPKDSLGPKEALTIAKSLYFAKKNKEAQNVLASLKKHAKADKKAVNEYLLRIQIRLGLNKDASETSNDLPDALNIAADELWLSGKRDRAVQIYSDMIKNGKKSEQPIYRTAMFMYDRSRAGYDSFMELYMKNFPDTENASQILWFLARSRLESDKTEETEKLLLQYLKKFPEGKYNDQCSFWLNKIYAKNGKRDLEQQMAFRLAAVNPDSPYTFILIERTAENMKAGDILRLFNNSAKNSDERFYYHCLLVAKEKSVEKRDKRVSLLNTAVQDNSKIETAMQNAASGKYKTKQLQHLEKYARVGYSEGIERVLAILPDSDAASAERAAALAYLGGKFSNPFYSSYYGQQLLRSLSIKENIFIFPKSFISLILPRPFANDVKTNSEAYGVDTNIIYSIMKAESQFQHKAKSSAGALGLMQLMPPTAKEIARNLKIAEYDMRTPKDNIRFGTNYLGWLKKYYKNDFIYMAAGYNAGAGNVNKWIKKMENKDSDYFTEFAAFNETRYYILRTSKFLSQYSIAP
ncbi:MAG: transglycosylase SLT domain-containing protein [Leptospirales bacterium]|nr:transglycosylase SLT domain-containing protein [Leptospirales bacterium]